MSQIFVSNIALDSAATSRIDLPVAANLRITVGSANTMYMNPARTAFPGNVAVDGVATLSNVTVSGTITANGSVVAVTNFQSGALVTGTTVMPLDDTIPSITEGDEYMSVIHTPKSANNMLRVEVIIYASSNLTASLIVAALYKDAVTDALMATASRVVAVNTALMLTLSYYMLAGTTSAITFRVRLGPSAAAIITLNGQSLARLFGGVAPSSITVTEISRP